MVPRIRIGFPFSRKTNVVNLTIVTDFNNGQVANDAVLTTLCTGTISNQ